MPKRLTVYLQDPVFALVEARTVGERTSSPTVAEMLSRYDELCKRAAPELGRVAWEELRECLQGWRHNDAATLDVALKIQVSRCGSDNLNDKVQAWSYIEAVAAVDAIERGAFKPEATSTPPE